MHTLAGPDHLASLTPLAVESRRRAWALGLRWSLGHASGVLAVGLLSISFREVLPLDLISSWGERLVGIVLIGIGLWGLRKALTRRVHQHEHEHGGHLHAHFHWHNKEGAHGADAEDTMTRDEWKSRHRHGHAAFGIGALHGLAGSSHFLAVLPALAFPSLWQGALYLLFYAVGTVLGMVGFSSLVGEAAQRLSFNGVRAYSGLMIGCSLLAVVVGGYWLVV